MKKPKRVLIITLIIFIAFFGAVYVSNLKSYTHFKSPNKIVLYENGHKKTYTRFSFKYRKILKALNARFCENSFTPMTSIVYKKDLDTMKNTSKVIVFEYNNTKASAFTVEYKYWKIKYCSIYFPLDGHYQNQAIYLLNREVEPEKPLNSLRITNLNSEDEVNKVLK